MPKSTFFNLPAEKQAKIQQVLLTLFYDRHVSQVRVAEIVEVLGMARGSFYKYFTDLEDAHTYLIKESSVELHREILNFVATEPADFFGGIQCYLCHVAELSHDSTEWKRIQLLTKSSGIFSYRDPSLTAESAIIQEWQKLLDRSQLVVGEFPASLAFLYFVMDLVMSSLTAFVVNQWNGEQLLQDYQYRIQWLTRGIKN